MVGTNHNNNIMVGIFIKITISWSEQYHNDNVMVGHISQTKQTLEIQYQVMCEAYKYNKEPTETNNRKACNEVFNKQQTNNKKACSIQHSTFFNPCKPKVLFSGA